MPFAIKPRQKVLFIGDSITDCGRRDANAPLGAGYVKIIHDLIVARYPDHRLSVVNKGIGGNTVRDLADRWTDDCLRERPDWLSIKVGINDVHLWMRNAPDRSVSAEEFEQLYDQILSRARKETSAQLILVDPFYISRDENDGSFRSGVLKQLPKYIRVVHRMARKHRARHVRSHELFRKVIKTHPPDSLCPEPVHPNQAGHTVLAHGWLAALGW